MEETFIASKPAAGDPWEVAIIGSGPASLTAAIYTTRGAASTLILGGERWGGQLMLTTEVDNYLISTTLLLSLRLVARNFWLKRLLSLPERKLNGWGFLVKIDFGEEGFLLVLLVTPLFSGRKRW